MNKSESPILIWCLCPYILSSLITSHLNESTQRYCIYTSDDYCNYLSSHGINSNIQLLKASSLRISRVQRFLHNIFVYFICSNKLSKLWSRDRTKFLSQSFFKRLTILFNLGFSPGSIRPIYLRVMRMFPPSIFTHCEIYVYTPCYDYFLFTSKTCTVYLVYDSWDHPFKYPILFSPASTYCWNYSISTTIADLHDIQPVFPVNTGRFLPYTSLNLVKPYKWVYAMAYSYKDSPTYFNFEVNIVRKLSQFCLRQGKPFHVKLKPLFVDHDFLILSSIEGVVLDSTISNSSITSNSFRLSQQSYLSEVELCFGLTTTFIIEASLRDVPVFLLNSLNSDNQILSDLSHNDQVVHYSLPLFLQCLGEFSSTQPLDLLDILSLDHMLAISRDFSTSLKAWLVDGVNTKYLPLLSPQKKS